MNNSSATSSENHPSDYKPLRIWIPLIFLPLFFIARKIPDFVEDGPSGIWMVSAFGPALISLVLIGWWVLLSRAHYKERILGTLGIIALLIAEQIFCDHSMRGPLLIVLTLPLTVFGFTVGTILFNKLLSQSRTVCALGLALLAILFSLAVKTEGVRGDFSFSILPRWKVDVEQSLAAKPMEPSQVVPASAFENAAWPKFRGMAQDGIQVGQAFDDEWSTNAPKELWRIDIGAGWSSFVVAGDYLFTQEQRGNNDCVICYQASTGKKFWQYSLESRFFEALGGLGPRATPTLSGTELYAQGAEGWLSKLDATTGKLIWKQDLRVVTDKALPPMWGFSSSPLIHDGKVIVHVGGKNANGIVALKTEDGSLAWKSPCGEHSYGSPQLIKMLDTDLISILSNEGAHFYLPDTGEQKFFYDWSHNGYRALQPQVIDGDKLIVPTGMGTGSRLIQLSKEDPGQWSASELWTSGDFKPDFNDFVVYQGHIYGFDNRIFACIDLATGKKKWKGGRYEKGQCLLLADSGLILVVSESGELALLKATPDSHQELAKIQALNDKTWNHPVVVGDKLYLRNAKEAVCYQLPTK
ncbi:MAG: PQQ-binding-like beta-propeller repeat protein [Pirellulales bacterium]